MILRQSWTKIRRQTLQNFPPPLNQSFCSWTLPEALLEQNNFDFGGRGEFYEMSTHILSKIVDITVGHCPRTFCIIFTFQHRRCSLELVPFKGIHFCGNKPLQNLFAHFAEFICGLPISLTFAGFFADRC